MNFIIIQTIKNSGKIFESTSKLKNDSHSKKGMEKRQKKIKSAENQLTVMLLLVTILYLVLQIPTYIKTIYSTFVTQDTPFKYVNATLSLMITHALSITSSGINFFLYCISGQKFRDDLKEMFCCTGKICVKKNESQSDSVFTVGASHSTLESTVHSDD